VHSVNASYWFNDLCSFFHVLSFNAVCWVAGGTFRHVKISDLTVAKSLLVGASLMWNDVASRLAVSK